MSIVSFDQLDNGETQANRRSDQPIWMIGWEDEVKLKEWLNNEFTSLKQESEERINDIRKHIALYKGIQYFSQEARTSRRDREEVTSKYKQKVVVNHLFDLTEQKISQAIKFKPNISVLPTNDELEDRISAKVAKKVADHVAYRQRFDYKRQEAVRIAYIAGECFTFVEWNPDLGPELKESKDMRESGEPLAMVKDGEELKDSIGRPKHHSEDEPINIGDVEIKNIVPHRIFVERVRDYKDAQFMFKLSIVETDKLKKRYPSKKDQIRVDKDKTYFDFTTFEETKLQRETWTFEFYYKHTREVPKGRYIKYTQDVILENRDLQYDHGDFPCERLVDIEIPEELHGRSFYIQTRHLQAHINNLTSMQMRNQYMAAHPKWFVPYGSVNLSSLGNDLTICQYRGPQPPVLAAHNPTGRETIELRKTLIDEMGQISASEVSRGDLPSGVTAAVAIQYLNELESDRAQAFTENMNEWTRRIFAKVISVCSQYYDKEDQRTVQIMGKDNTWMSEALDPKHLTKSYDVRIQNTSALPKTKSGMMQAIIDLNDSFPGMFSPEQVLAMLDMGKSDRFYHEGAGAIRTAEMQYEMLTEGEPVPDPQEWEFHIPHWNVFAKRIQDTSFYTLDQESRDRVLNHLRAREFLMIEKSKVNPAFSQEVGKLTQFPMMMSLPPEPQSPPEETPIEPEQQLPEAMPLPGQDNLAAQSAIPVQEEPGSGPLPELPNQQ